MTNESEKQLLSYEDYATTEGSDLSAPQFWEDDDDMVWLILLAVLGIIWGMFCLCCDRNIAKDIDRHFL